MEVKVAQVARRSKILQFFMVNQDKAVIDDLRRQFDDSVAERNVCRVVRIFRRRVKQLKWNQVCIGSELEYQARPVGCQGGPDRHQRGPDANRAGRYK